MGFNSTRLFRICRHQCLGHTTLSFILAVCVVFLTSCARTEQAPPRSQGQETSQTVARSGYEVEHEASPPPRVIVLSGGVDTGSVGGVTLPKRGQGKSHAKKARPTGDFAGTEGNAEYFAYQQFATGSSLSDTQKAEAEAALVQRRSLHKADAALAEELKANVVYNAPTTMVLGEPTDIELLISRNTALDALEAQLDADGPRRDARIKVAEHVEAVLNGDGFDVKALTSEEQLVGSSNVTQWRWRVTPNIAGQQRELDLTISDALDDGRKEVVNAQAVYHSSIRVTVSIPWVVKKWIGENWKWSCTAVVFPLIVWAWKQRGGHKRNPSSKRRRSKP